MLEPTPPAFLRGEQLLRNCSMDRMKMNEVLCCRLIKWDPSMGTKCPPGTGCSNIMADSRFYPKGAAKARRFQLPIVPEHQPKNPRRGCPETNLEATQFATAPTQAHFTAHNAKDPKETARPYVNHVCVSCGHSAFLPKCLRMLLQY